MRRSLAIPIGPNSEGRFSNEERASIVIIAGASVMFALVQGVLLRPLPVHDQNRLLVA
jgi:hypothetical protein